jgi:hypothetical protein
VTAITYPSENITLIDNGWNSDNMGHQPKFAFRHVLRLCNRSYLRYS